ncbi:hypothetical protein TIFTF001_033417 [Ficus carica]|uniref:TF-B3 domain-containing protein n=1 Tax=Ficus carica TaxID=3494 RepID=A0AA88DYT6_FICCA|nr:hypothetical protein TIFTF001_033417 [Ficus carica]
MSVPTHWVGKKSLLPMPNPGEPTVLPVRDQNGNDTTLRLEVRLPTQDQRHYNPRPVFMFEEWRDLVDAYDLKKGESVYFWREGGYLRVKVHTPPRYITSLFGINIYGWRRYHVDATGNCIYMCSRALMMTRS